MKISGSSVLLGLGLVATLGAGYWFFVKKKTIAVVDDKPAEETPGSGTGTDSGTGTGTGGALPGQPAVATVTATSVGNDAKKAAEEAGYSLAGQQAALITAAAKFRSGSTVTQAIDAGLLAAKETDAHAQTPFMTTPSTSAEYYFRNALTHAGGTMLVVDNNAAYGQFVIGDYVQVVSPKYSGNHNVYYVNNAKRADGSMYAVVYISKPFAGDDAGTIKKAAASQPVTGSVTGSSQVTNATIPGITTTQGGAGGTLGLASNPGINASPTHVSSTMQIQNAL